MKRKQGKLRVFSCEKSYRFVPKIDCAIFSWEKKAGGNGESKLQAKEFLKEWRKILIVHFS